MAFYAEMFGKIPCMRVFSRPSIVDWYSVRASWKIWRLCAPQKHTENRTAARKINQKNL
nr:MAG TPA: hypothetical protein [Caudoviricetes sp.]